jgi:ATP synthase protein I
MGGTFPVQVHLMRQAHALHAKRTLKVQALLGLVATVVFLPFGGHVALSALIGAAVCLSANALFAVSVFRSYRAQEPERILLRIYGAEVAKLALILGLFGVAFVTVGDLNLPVLLGAYLVTQVASPIIAAQSEVHGRFPRATEHRSER